MIHYHGLPITPDTCAEVVIRAGHAFVSFRHPGQLGLAIDACQSFAVDNGAFSAWKSGETVNWEEYYTWVQGVARVPSFDFAVIPDVIDGDEDQNDALIEAWPLGAIGAPVWHMHESVKRLERLCRAYPRVCLGSSGAYARIGSMSWWNRMDEAMRVACDSDGRPLCKLHGLRMLDPLVFQRLPLASADSTNVGRNIGLDDRWQGPYAPPTKQARAQLMRVRIETYNAPDRYDTHDTYQTYFWKIVGEAESR